MRKVILTLLFEAYAVFLALCQYTAGLRTDEAKYLLNIPYPHPPLVRWLLSQTEWLPFQELFWRIAFATLLVQAVWVVIDLTKHLDRTKQWTVAAMWLLSSAVVYQSGTIMMAPLTALQGLALVWCVQRPELVKRYSGWLALGWLAALFTAYQAVLYGPLVLWLYSRMSLPRWQQLAAAGVPVALVGLYVATNPLAAASFVNAGTQNTHLSLFTAFTSALHSWAMAGGVVFSVVGTAGAIRARQYGTIASILLVGAFLMISFRPYYSVLFLPLFVAGIVGAPRLLKHTAFLLALQILLVIFVYSGQLLQSFEPESRRVMRQVNQLQVEGNILITGSFGHDWQYESVSPVRRYRAALLSSAKAVVCLQACPEVSYYNFRQIPNISTEVWVRVPNSRTNR